MILFNPNAHAANLATGALVAAALAWAAARWLGPRGLMDVPGDRHGHEQPTPRTGGLALFAAIALGYALGFRRLDLMWEQWLGLVVLAATGLVDDRWGLRARHKALVGLLVAGVMAAPGATRMVLAHPSFDLLGFLPLPPVWPLAFLLLLLLYWFIPQAMNLIDGANGLAIGYALVLVAALALAGRPLSFFAGILVGLLALNWPRARHFLGDSGSLALGLLLALEVKRGVGVIDPDFVLWMFAYPLVDVATVVTIRLLLGRSLGLGDRSHLHHQWLDRFPNHRRWVVPGLWLQAGLCASAPLVHGWGWLIPGLGLSLLAGQAFAFISLSVVSGRVTAAEDLALQSIEEDESTDGKNPPGGTHHAA